MKTFKQFLEDQDPLDRTVAEMWLRHHLKVDQEDAEEALNWLRQKDNWLPDQVWKKMIALARTGMHETKDFDALLGGQMQDDVVRFYLAKMMLADDIKLAESSDPLHDTAIEMALRKEFDMSQAQAEEGRAWLQGEKDAQDLGHWAWDRIWSRWEDQLDDFGSARHEFEEFIHGKVLRILKSKYKVEV